MFSKKTVKTFKENTEKGQQVNSQSDQPPCPGCQGEGKMPLVVSLDPPQSIDADCPLCQENRSAKT